MVGDSLDGLIGSWSKAEESEFLQAISVLEDRPVSLAMTILLDTNAYSALLRATTRSPIAYDEPNGSSFPPWSPASSCSDSGWVRASRRTWPA